MSDVTQIENIARSAASRMLGDYLYSSVAETITTDATVTDLLLIPIDDQTAGIFQVHCVGFDGLDAVTGIKQVRYKKVAGSLTLGVVDQLLTLESEGNMSTALFTIVKSGENIAVQVQGYVGEVSWKAEYKLVNVLKEGVLT